MIFEADTQGADLNFQAFKDNPQLLGERERIENLWHRYKPFADANFETEIRNDFYARFWEMYLACFLLDSGHELLKASQRPANGAGPDICIRSENPKIWIEAVTPKSGEGQNQVLPPRISEAEYVDEHKIILRYTSSIDDKKRKFISYKGKGIVQDTDICIIALNGGAIPSDSGGEIPYAVQAVLPFGPPYINVSRSTGQVVESGRTWRESIEKPTGSLVSTSSFLMDENAFITGLIFARISPSAGDQEISLFHNPKASTPLSHGWIKRGVEWWVASEENRLKLEGKRYFSSTSGSRLSGSVPAPRSC